MPAATPKASTSHLSPVAPTDLVRGDGGNNSIWEYTGVDTLTGEGADRFVFAWDAGGGVAGDYSRGAGYAVDVYDRWMPTEDRHVETWTPVGQEPALIEKWKSDAGSGAVLDAHIERFMPQNLENSGPADPVLHAYFQDRLDFAPGAESRASTFTDAVVNTTYGNMSTNVAEVFIVL